jgi:hypothetical protein
MNPKRQTAIKWGLIGGVSSALLGLLFFILNLESSSWLNYLSFAVMIGVIIAGTYEFRDKILGGFASLKKLLGFGILLALVYGIISSMWAVFFMEVLDPGLVKEILLDTEIRMEEQGMSDVQIKQALEVTKKMMKPYLFFFTSLISILFFGSLVSLLTSLVMRKDKPEEIIIEEKLAE